MPHIETFAIDPPQSKKSKSLGKRIFVGGIKFVLYIAFVALAIFYTPRILSKQLNTPYPMAVITSSSMWPQLKVNDLIFMKGITGKEAEVGQVIIYKNQKGFTIHRLIRKSNGKLVTKGDANNIEDIPITEDQVVGRAIYMGEKVFRIPFIGIVGKNLGPKLQNLGS